MEVLILLYDFIRTRRRSFLYSLSIPVLIGWAILLFITPSEFATIANSFRSNILTVMGILLGFSISLLAIFITAGNPNIENSKKHKLDIKICEKEISLFDKIIINNCYIIILNVIIILACFILPFFIKDNSMLALITYCIILCLAIHSIFMIVRIMLDLYFIVSKPENDKPTKN